jgi:hypothetical protein
MRKVASLLKKQSGALQHSLEHSLRLKQLDYAIKALLPEELASHCRIANLRKNRVVMQADSTAWATRLRYQTPEILKQLQEYNALQGIKSIQVTVAPASKPRGKTRRQARPLSEQNARIIRSAAESLADPELAAALRRLARNTRH